MARDRKEIQQEIIQEVNNKLPELNSQSATAIWRLWTYVVSMAIWTFERILGVHKEDIKNIVDSKRLGTLQWYSAKAKEFQNGDDLKINKYGECYYETISEEKKIVSVASTVFNEDTGLSIKVARSGEGNNLEPLDLTQEGRLKSYIDKIKIVGTKINIVNENADRLKLDIDINTSSLLDKEQVKTEVKNKINEFLKELPFDGKLSLNAFREAIRSLENVEDIYVNKISVLEGEREVYFTKGIYNSRAGYVVLDEDNLVINIV